MLIYYVCIVRIKKHKKTMEKMKKKEKKNKKKKYQPNPFTYESHIFTNWSTLKLDLCL